MCSGAENVVRHQASIPKVTQSGTPTNMRSELVPARSAYLPLEKRPLQAADLRQE
jgi:hypothetical protein